MPTKKEQCKALMSKFFGPATAAQVDNMSEEECIIKCKTKTAGFLGAAKAAEFDNIK